jgi:type IV pilus assembly protein PilM
VIGLDIGSTAVRAVQLKFTRTRRSVVAQGSEQLPRGVVVHGVINDAPALTDAISRLIGPSSHFTAGHVCVALGAGAAIVKRVTLPPMPEAELGEAAHREAARHIPFDTADVNVDFHVLRRPARTEPPQEMEVLVAAARSERVEGYRSVIEQAGRVAAIMDITAFALENIYHANYTADADSLVVLLNVGAGGITMNVLKGGQAVFVRDLSVGGDVYTEALEKELGVSNGAAEQLKRGIAAEGRTMDEARPTFRAVTKTVLDEMQRTFEFHSDDGAMPRCDRVMVTGGCSRIDGFREMLRDRLSAPVEELHPFRLVRWDASRLGSGPETFAPTGAIAAGLALRQLGD